MRSINITGWSQKGKYGADAGDPRRCRAARASEGDDGRHYYGGPLPIVGEWEWLEVMQTYCRADDWWHGNGTVIVDVSYSRTLQIVTSTLNMSTACAYSGMQFMYPQIIPVNGMVIRITPMLLSVHSSILC